MFVKERLSVDESDQSCVTVKSHTRPVDQLMRQTTMTSQTQVPGGPASPADSVSGSGSCHALRASMPVVRSPNRSSDCSLGTSNTDIQLQNF